MNSACEVNAVTFPFRDATYTNRRSRISYYYIADVTTFAERYSLVYNHEQASGDFSSLSLASGSGRFSAAWLLSLSRTDLTKKLHHCLPYE